MKITVGSILAIITLVATILVGGANFGSLRSATTSNADRLVEHRMHIDTMAVQLRKESMENMRIVSKMSADIEWIKDHIRNLNREKG